MNVLPSAIPLPLAEDILKDVVQKSKDWALMHGAGMRSKDNFSKDSMVFAPFVLTPSAFPRKEFERAVRLQTTLNELMHQVAHHRQFLTHCLKDVVQVDEFTGNLFKIYETVQDEGVTQPVCLGMLRSDLMLESRCSSPGRDCPRDSLYCCWKQVEFNSIASGFGWLGPASAHIQSRRIAPRTQGNDPLAVQPSRTASYAYKVSLGLLRSDYMVHCNAGNKIKQVEINTIASSFGGIISLFCTFNRFVLEELGQYDKTVNLPVNNALQGLCSGMLDAYKIYGKENAIILFIVENVTYNICDQRFHEFELRKMNPDVKVIRRTLTDMTRAKLGPQNELLIDEFEVAVVYYRAGYEPSHYPSQSEWDARLLMEKSQAIKCPSIQYHLAGTKKVQQELSKSDNVEMFLNESSKIDAVRDIFTGLYSLDFDEFGEQGIQMALDSPEKFVLKPQREGGGNNVYGVEIRDAIMAMKNSKERTAWILMERIIPPISRSYMIRPGGPDLPPISDLISELGIFGVIIGDSTKIYRNEQIGHMLRTKISSANEGGVAAGLGALDSPYLID